MRRHSRLYSDHADRAKRARLCYDQPSRKVSSQPIEQLVYTSGHAAQMLSYSFIVEITMSFLDDGDVVTRLLLTHKDVRRMTPKYGFKWLCCLEEALWIIQASRDVMYFVKRVSVLHNQLVTDLGKTAAALLEEIHYTNVTNLAGGLLPVPAHVTHLRFTEPHHFEPLPVGWIPSGVLEFDAFEPCLLQKGSLPASVRTIKMTIYPDQFDAALLPPSLTTLYLRILRPVVDHVLPERLNTFPPSLTCLSLTTCAISFDVGVLPSSLKELMCSNRLLNLLPPKAIPNSVFKLTIQWNDHCAPGIDVVPHSITHLLNDDKNCAMSPWDLPPKLTHLSFSNVHFDRGIVLPTTLTHLSGFDIPADMIPFNVKYLVTDKYSCSIPSSVTHCRMNNRLLLQYGDISLSITHLVFSCCRQQTMRAGIIPNSVKHLEFDYRFNQPIPSGAIPSSVTFLVFGEYFNQLLASGSIPESVTHLCFGGRFNKPVHHNIIPSSVTHLVLGRKWNHELLPGVLPNSITYLAFGPGFEGHLTRANLPIFLNSLEIPRGFVSWIPAGLERISYKALEPQQRSEFCDFHSRHLCPSNW